MSAFIVSKAEIDVLVAAGGRLADENAPQEGLNRLGQALLDECVRSVSYRYSDDDPSDLPGCFVEETFAPGIAPVTFGEWLTPYVFGGKDLDLTRELVDETVRCYEYQSCEHPEWPESWAHQFCIGLRTCLEHFPPAPKDEPPKLDPEEFRRLYGSLDRDETIKRIRSALKRRSGKSWSVTGGRGTGYGWIHIQAPPKRRTGAHVQRPGADFGEYEHIDTGKPQEFGIMTPQDCAELAELLGKDRVHHQGENIPASSEYRREYIDRAEGRTPAACGSPYWD